MRHQTLDRRLANCQTKVKPWLFLSPAIILLCLVIVFPIFKVIEFSFHENMFNAADPAFIGFKNYLAVIRDSRFTQMLVFTLIFTLGSVLLHVICGLLFAVMLNTRINPRALAVYRVIFVLPWVFTAAIVALVWQLMLTPQGVINALLSVFLQKPVAIEWLADPKLAIFSLLMINAWRGYPTCVVSFLAGLQNIPLDMYEAADMDGASKLRQFFSLTIPQLKPVILSVSLLDGIWTMNLFPLIWLTTGGGPQGVTESIATFTYRLSFTEFQFGHASAMAVIGLILTLTFVLFYLRAQKTTD